MIPLDDEEKKRLIREAIVNFLVNLTAGIILLLLDKLF